MMEREVIVKIDQFKKELDHYDEGSKQEVREWEKAVRKALEVLSLEETNAIKVMRKKYEEDNQKIDYLLMNDEKMTEDQRRLNFLKKKWNNKFLNIFNTARSTVQEIEKAVDRELE